jgi:SAM-dependent methyltransferase
MSKKAPKIAPVEQPKPLKIDLGCGPGKKEGFIGVDTIAFPSVDIVADLRKAWPWKDGTVDEAHASHFVEHLEADERVHFVNELYRVLKPGARCAIITPHWAASRAYGDMTHKWPPVSEFWYFYLNAEWRKANAPHNDGYTCDFDATWGYGVRPDLNLRAPEHQQYALANFKEAAQDLVATLTKREVKK